MKIVKTTTVNCKDPNCTTERIISKLESIRCADAFWFESARSPRGHVVTLRAFLSPLRHMEQLLLVTSCDSLAVIGARLWTHGRTNGRMNRWTDRLLC